MVNVFEPGTSAIAALSFMCLTCAACGGASSRLVQPVGETHKDPSSTGGARPRGHDEPSADVGIVIGDEVRRACKMAEAPEVVPRFDVEAERLRPLGADDSLARVASCVGAGGLGGAKLWLIGYADRRGDADYNYRLGLYRASATKQHLVELGAPTARMSVESAGATEAKGTDEGTWALDHRIEVHLANAVRPLRRPEPRPHRRR
jgi:peptidoglycan-associated lipoprotein